jgi:hypothetical protein
MQSACRHAAGLGRKGIPDVKDSGFVQVARCAVAGKSGLAGHQPVSGTKEVLDVVKPVTELRHN